MEELLKSLPEKAKSKHKDFKLLASRVKKLKPANADRIFQDLHHEAFDNINCLECANCCRGLGPRIIQSDIERISAYLKIKTASFIDDYLQVDEDNDHVFKNMPCPFLLEDNYCMVYPARPRACREYPHTDRKNIQSILSVCIKNTETCPAVFRIFENLPKVLKNK
jgi:uncharacterized protein